MQLKVIGGAAAIFLLGPCAYAQQAPAPAPAPDFDKVVIKATDLGNRTYMLEGAGGNITIGIGDNGVIMVDSQFEPLAGKIKAAIAALTPQPVRFLINTHFHRDHTGGNAAFAKDGAIVVAHENVKTRLAAGSRSGTTGNVVPPAPPEALPAHTYKDIMVLTVRGHVAELRHAANVHTDGDTYIRFPYSNVLVAGDLLFLGRYPNIDYLYGGSIDGQIRGADELLQIVDDNTKIVPGHGPVGNKAMLREYRQMLVEARDRIRKLKAAGKTEDEIIAARPNADYDKKFGADERAIGNFIRVVYRSLKD